MHIGRCLCGAVRFEIDGELSPIQICHCSQCRRAQGSAFAANIPVDVAAFRLVAGAEDLRSYESSPGKTRRFCGRCGSPVLSSHVAVPGQVRVRAGLLEPPVAARPAFHFFTESKADWWSITDDLPRYPHARPTWPQ
jgi:hypothetical protein